MPLADVPGSADGTQSILLRRRSDAESWDRLTGQAGLGVGDRLLSLEPFHTPVRIGPHSIEMIDQAEIRLLGPADDGHRQRQALGLPAGQPSAGGALHPGQAEALQQVVGVERVAAVGGEQAQHLAGAQARVGAAALRHDAHPRPQRRVARVARPGGRAGLGVERADAERGGAAAARAAVVGGAPPRVRSV